MEILSVTLKNFKAHSDRHFVFQPGTNAICGENGAGKTSILEAIAWTLFNHRGAYNKEDLIRNGAGNAQARVAFVSNRDGRTYEVERCTLRGYTVFDPQIQTKLDLKHIEEEILPWLRQQMGVAPGTDLARLFANTIGVPQGMFTADFLQPPDKRKAIFDAVLKVEEYRQTAQEMLSLEKYGKAEVDCLERSIAQDEEGLQEWEGLQQRQQELTIEIAANEANLAQLQQALVTLQTQRDQSIMQAQQVQQMMNQLQNLGVQVEAKQQANELLQQAVQRSQQAVTRCQANRQAYDGFLRTEAVLRQFDERLKERQKLLKQRDVRQKELTEKQTELTRLSIQLENLEHAADEIAELQPLIAQQEAIETQQKETIEQLNQIQAVKAEQNTLTRQLTKLQAEQAKLHQDIDRLQPLESQVAQIAEWEKKRDRIQEQLSRVEAAKQFEAELRQLVSGGEEKRDRHQLDADQALASLRHLQHSVSCLADNTLADNTLAEDAFAAAVAAIESGVVLNTDLLNSLWRILADLSEQVSVPKLQQQLQQLKASLESAYRSRAELSTLEAKLNQQAHLHQECEQIQQRLNQLKTELLSERDLQQRRQALIAQLAQLNNPRGRKDLLDRQLQQHSALNAQHSALQTQQAQIAAAIAQLETHLQPFADLDEQIDAQKQQRQADQTGYLIYLQHQKEANELGALQEKSQEAIAQLQGLQRQRDQVKQECDRLSATFDPLQLQQLEETYHHTRSQADRLVGGLPQQRKLLDELNARMTVLSEIAARLDRTQRELKQKEKIRKFIAFARKAYREAGPRITERYVQTISQESDRLFRELLNRPNVALEWTKEYEVLVQEGPHSRRFVNLSGGEQMCAALAVRLALLRVLADIDVAFFDEPTTNMDRPRRESLAEAIANIKSFRQLFVISHDDTFEKVTENVIVVNRE